MIACVRLPYFVTAFEKRVMPSLDGTIFAIGIPSKQPTQIDASSPEAVKVGIKPGMSIVEAQILEPTLRIIPASPIYYRRQKEKIHDLLSAFSPCVEANNGIELRADNRRRKQVPYHLNPAQANDQIYYLDLGKLANSDCLQIAESIKQAIGEEININAAIGLASDKFTARVTALSLTPGEVVIIASSQEAAFLADYPVTLLPADGEALRQFELLGLRTLGQFAALPVSAVVQRFGKDGKILHRLATGRDTSKVATYAPPHLERVSRELDSSINDRGILEAVLTALAGELAQRLTISGHLAQRLELILSLENRVSCEADTLLRQPTAAPSQLTEAVQRLLASIQIVSGVVGIELTVIETTAIVGKQLSLFQQPSVSRDQLRSLLKELVNRYGEECFYWIIPSDQSARLPERRFSLEKVDVS